MFSFPPLQCINSFMYNVEKWPNIYLKNTSDYCRWFGQIWSSVNKKIRQCKHIMMFARFVNVIWTGFINKSEYHHIFALVYPFTEPQVKIINLSSAKQTGIVWKYQRFKPSTFNYIDIKINTVLSVSSFNYFYLVYYLHINCFICYFNYSFDSLFIYSMYPLGVTDLVIWHNAGLLCLENLVLMLGKHILVFCAF